MEIFKKTLKLINIQILIPSILEIQNKCKNQIKFAFEEINLASVEKEINNLKINKASQSSDIPTKIIKENVDIFAEFLWKTINSSIERDKKTTDL